MPEEEEVSESISGGSDDLTKMPTTANKLINLTDSSSYSDLSEKNDKSDAISVATSPLASTSKAKINPMLLQRRSSTLTHV